jgi:hypothetical protein
MSATDLVPNTRQKTRPKDLPKAPENAAAISLTMWREQGKDQMPQCFMGELTTRL